MWLKILKGIVVVAQMVGLDKKVKGWVRGRLDKAEGQALEQLDKVSKAIQENEK